MKAKHFKYLDELRKSGVTNMYGASPYLENAFGIDPEAARKILTAWMKTFDLGKTPAERIAVASSKGNAS